MAIKNLPFTKCTLCGKTTLTDEYFLTGCSHCGDKLFGVDNHAFKTRQLLSELQGTNVFVGRFQKLGNFHFNQGKSYVLVENIKCGREGVISNHTYINNISPNTINLLRTIEPGTQIQFKANVHKYGSKWGLDHMCHVIPIDQ